MEPAGDGWFLYFSSVTLNATGLFLLAVMKMATKKLTKKEKLFVKEYIASNFNGAEAAKKAGYSGDSASQIAYQLLQKTSVKNAINQEIQDRAFRCEIRTDMVIRELAKVAFADLKDFVSFGPTDMEIVNKDGSKTIIPNGAWRIEIKDSSDVDGAVLAEVSESPKTGRKIKLHDKVKALELLGKHLGMFKEQVEVNAESGITFVIGKPAGLPPGEGQ
jgi:phage terminase small subunit